MANVNCQCQLLVWGPTDIKFEPNVEPSLPQGQVPPVYREIEIPEGSREAYNGRMVLIPANPQAAPSTPAIWKIEATDRNGVVVSGAFELRLVDLREITGQPGATIAWTRHYLTDAVPTPCDSYARFQFRLGPDAKPNNPQDPNDHYYLRIKWPADVPDAEAAICLVKIRVGAFRPDEPPDTSEPPQDQLDVIAGPPRHITLLQVVPPGAERIGGGLPIPGPDMRQQLPPCECSRFFISTKKGAPDGSEKLQYANLLISSVNQSPQKDGVLHGTIETKGPRQKVNIAVLAGRDVDTASPSKLIALSSSQLANSAWKSPQGTTFSADSFYLEGTVDCGTPVNFEIRPRRYSALDAAARNKELAADVASGRLKHITRVADNEIKVGYSNLYIYINGVAQLTDCRSLQVRVGKSCDCVDYQKDIQTVLADMASCQQFKDRRKVILQQLQLTTIGVTCKPEESVPGWAKTAANDVEVKCGTPLDMLYGIILFEMLNIEDGPANEQLSVKCLAGDVSREDFIRAKEKAEYDNMADLAGIVKACGWPKLSDLYANRVSQWKTFEDYYKEQKKVGHTEHYGQTWDEKCQRAWKAKNG